MDKRAQSCDVLVIGAGPAGLSAALAAAESGKQTILLDQSPWLGGQIWRSEESHSIPPEGKGLLENVKASGIVVFSEATVFAAPSPRVIQADTPTQVLEITWKKLILATGARELFLPFPGWTLPGVLGPGGLHAMAKAGWPVRGKRVVVAGTGPLLLAAADGLRKQGAQIQVIAEQAPFSKILRFGFGLLRYPGKLVQGMGVKSRLLGVPYRCGCWPVQADGVSSVERVTLSDGVHSWTEPCDYLACGFHLVPNIELAVLLGCELDGDTVKTNELQETTQQDILCAGEPTGVAGVECALVEGRLAGLVAAGRATEARALQGKRAAWHRFRGALQETFSLRPELRTLAAVSTIVCRCEDVRHGDLASCKDGRSAKLHTRCGMGACQGRTCGASTRFLFGWEPSSVRPPVFPVPVGAFIASPKTDSRATLP